MKIGLRIFLGYFLIVAVAAWLLMRVFVAEVKPGVRQAMEDTLVDSANVLAELASDDLLTGRIADGRFADRVRGLRGRDFGADIWGFEKRSSTYRIYVTDARGTVVFDSEGVDVGADYSRWNNVYLTLRGRYGARSTASDPKAPDSTVMHVSAPIRGADGAIAGVLTVAKPNSALAPFIARSEAKVLRWGGLLLGLALLVGLLASWWLSRQIARLQRYAQAVSGGERAVMPQAAGEFGELGQALETMRAKLEGKQYVERYVHALTHEMKGPLAAIRGSAELLEAPLADADRQRFAATIGEQSQRMAEMIEKLLALAAVEHQQRLDAPVLIDLRELARDAASQCAPGVAAAGVELVLDVEDRLPRVLGDPFLLRQAMVNLIENAVDFSTRSASVELRIRRDDKTVQVDVCDRGPGVPDYALPRVFERFYSLPRPGGGSRSSGLGLCFVAEVVALHGGHAELTNREGGGACSQMSIPAMPDA